MKLSIVASALAGSALADWSIIQSDMGKMLNSSASPQTITQSDMALLNEYGCWCFFEADGKYGRSHPVDMIDAMCKRLHDGYECAAIDAAAMGEECIAWNVIYNSAVGSGLAAASMGIDEIRTECENVNPVEGCMQWACQIEGYFVQQLFLAFTHGTIIDENMRHAMGFDFDASCPVNKGVKSEKECCSDYPLRFPFKAYGGARACCVSHTYNAGILTCCADGVVRMTCP